MYRKIYTNIVATKDNINSLFNKLRENITKSKIYIKFKYIVLIYTKKIIITLKATLLGSCTEYVYTPVPAKLSVG